MRTVLLPLVALSLMAADAPKAPSDTDKAEFYRLVAIQARINAEQYRLAEIAKKAKADLEQFIAKKRAEGCQIQETDKGLECEAPAEAQKK